MTMEFALRQLKRLDVFRARRMSTEAQLEYIKAIKTAKNEQIAEEAIGALCRYGDRYPYPSEIVKTIANLQDRGVEQSLKLCPVCDGTGYVGLKGPYTGQNRTVQQFYRNALIEVTEPCRSCPKGKAIQVSRNAMLPVATRSSLAKIGETDTERLELIDEQKRAAGGSLFDDLE